jgi:hypothetical protein
MDSTVYLKVKMHLQCPQNGLRHHTEPDYTGGHRLVSITTVSYGLALYGDLPAAVDGFALVNIVFGDRSGCDLHGIGALETVQVGLKVLPLETPAEVFETFSHPVGQHPGLMLKLPGGGFVRVHGHKRETPPVFALRGTGVGLKAGREIAPAGIEGSLRLAWRSSRAADIAVGEASFVTFIPDLFISIITILTI